MKPNATVYRTAKGEEIAASHGDEISSNQRYALRAVDGHSTCEHLVQKAFWVTDMAKTLDELEALGLVSDQRPARPAAAPAAAPPPAPAAPPPPLKAQLAALAREMLGDNAERIVKKIEDTDGSPGALEQALLSCKKIIKLTISEELAEHFLARGREVLNR